MSLLKATGGNTLGRKSETAGTVISTVVPPGLGNRTIIASLLYLCGSTAHTLSILRPIGRTKFTAAAAAAQAVVYIKRNPGPTGDGTRGAPANNQYPQGVTANLLAASDLVAIREIDGVTRLYTVSSVDTTNPLKVTLTANLAAGVDDSDYCAMWDLGVLADVDPSTGLAHWTRLAVVSVVNTYSGVYSGAISTARADEPILIQSDNATAAGAFNSVEYAYVPSAQ